MAFDSSVEFDMNMFGHASPGTKSAMNGYQHATLEALKVEKALFPYVQHKPECDSALPFSPALECTCGCDVQLTILRQRLGINTP